ncbi:hypothetical protein ABG768_015609 [Culter alburnus]|uniref:Uncharacterized protein n=1 Tax=Culter alburnus TaxID=194366 RepID=A0AAW1Z4B8_CULAL
MHSIQNDQYRTLRWRRARFSKSFVPSARSRARRKRCTIDLMSDEEDGIIDGVSRWIVRPPSFHSQELTKLCATLQSRLEAIPKYRATHHRRLQNGLNSDRMPLVTYSSKAENRDFMVL